MVRVIGLAATVLAAAAATAEAGDNREAKADAPSAFTLGAVQRDLRTGLSQAEVVERLGSPNILARDGDGREAWVYDRVASELEAASVGVSIGGAGTGGSGSLAGLLGIRAGKSRRKLSSLQRTLTVVVRFSAAGTVESFTWHHSRF